MLYQAAIVYSRTSMFPHHRSIPPHHQHDPHLHADTERRCASILTLASTHLETDQLVCRHDLFPLFIAGVATTQPDAKIHAIDCAKAFERAGGIGRNTARTRRLLVAVCEEQRRVVGAGGRMEMVEWWAVAEERGLGVVNCGL